MKRKGSGSIFDTPMVYVDIETNGLDHVRGKVIEVAAIRTEGGKIVRTFNSLLDPGCELPQFITRLTGIQTSDLRGAPTFAMIADELAEVLDGAIFVAHNVRFDYSFLKQEYKRLGRPFLPKQLCTARLSRCLFPEYKSHKLQSLIERYNFTFASRHRAYDDAAVLIQFVGHVRQTVAVEIIEAAIAKQIRRPAIPKHIDESLVTGLPEGPGVYIFEDERGQPLYVGKSIDIRKRVLQHFGHDHDESKEFKISQAVRHVRHQSTDGELSALLLESKLVKELQPVFNRRLRRVSKLTVARKSTDETGYDTLTLEEATPEVALQRSDTLATYPRKSQAKKSLEEILRQYELCPKLLGLEKAANACFLYQLGKCRGACVGSEPVVTYNHRLHSAFARRRIETWPYAGPVLVKESASSGIVVDNWCVLAEITQEPECEPIVTSAPKTFDLDTYKILQSFMGNSKKRLQVIPLAKQQLADLGVS